MATSSGLPVRSHRALAHVDPGGAVAHEADLAVARRHIVGAGDLADEFLEHRAVGLETVGVDVGDIVGNDVEFALKRDLTR